MNSRFYEVKSSNIAAIRYDYESRLLDVRFATGKVYRYKGVPPLLVVTLLWADSVGKVFHASIRDTYPHEILATEAGDANPTLGAMKVQVRRTTGVIKKER